MLNQKLIDFKDACNKIIQAGSDPKQINQVNWAVNYARHGLLVHTENEMHVQALYILGNIARWRGDTAKKVRAFLKTC